MAKEEPWEFPSEINERKRRYIVSIRLAKPISPRFALVADEIVHHLRSSLDHLACHLVETSGTQVTNSTAWPIVRTRREWTRKIERRQRPWQFWRKKGGGPLAGGTPEVRAFIESTQPYMRGGKARDDPLFGLEELWNTEKHRILNATPIYARPPDLWSDLFKADPLIQPVEFKWLLDPDRELKLETATQLALIRFPMSRPLPKVVMKGELPVEIAIGDGKGDRIPVQETLDLIRRIVGEAKAAFPLSN